MEFSFVKDYTPSPAPPNFSLPFGMMIVLAVIVGFIGLIFSIFSTKHFVKPLIVKEVEKDEFDQLEEIQSLSSEES